MKRKIILVLCALLLAAGLASCGPKNENAQPFEPYFTGNVYNPEYYFAGGVEASLSTANDGYVGFRVWNDRQIVIQVENANCTYNFFAPMDGSIFYLPVNCESGDYVYNVMQNTTENKYILMDAMYLYVDLNDELDPFLHANMYARYDGNSECVAKASELAAEAETELDFVKSVYKFVGNHLTYDKAKAETVADGYVPDPDRTYAEGKGICFDYSSLAAAMLRSQGIPTKIVTGYVGKDAAYHAWNSIYTKESGWLSVEIKLSDEDWTRMDVTYSDSLGSSLLSYTDRYYY